MQKALCTFLLLCSFIGLSQKSLLNHFSIEQSLYKWQVIRYDKLMGSTFILTAIDSSQSKAQKACEDATEFGRAIEAKISSWNKNSQTSKINQYAGIRPVKVDKDLFDLIYRSKKISELTDGAFDISYASIDNIWDFTLDTLVLPSEKEIKEAVAKINYQDIILNSQDTSVYLKTQGMKIGFGAIGKGYLADEIKKFLIAKGIQSGIVNAGGDLITWGSPPKWEYIKDTAWEVGIANPKIKNSVLGKLKIKDQALVTSGDYEKYTIINGKKFCHIINPKTGYPVAFLNSVSVLCNSAELADALATAIFVMGEKEGIDLVNSLNGIEAVAIRDKEIFSSKNITIENYQTLQGEYKFMADYGAFRPCGSSKWTAISFPDQSYAENLYRTTLNEGNNNNVLLTAKGSFIEEKRESKTIVVFKVTEILNMVMKKCD